MTAADQPALAVVVPAGPADDVHDTVESILHFTEAPRRIVVVDDSGHNLARSLEAMSSDVFVLPAPAAPPGTLGTLWIKIAVAYRNLLSSFAFDVLLRLDTDALLIGPHIAKLACDRFAANERVGMLGSYRIGPDGAARSWADPAATLRRECGLRGMDRPAMRSVLRSLRTAALANGYVDGEHALGGAFVHSRAAVLAMADRGWLDLPALERSHLGDDHLFSLITRAAGYRIGDFGGPDDPLALRWKGLPAAPSHLLAHGKVVTHSVRFWQDMGEAEIRSIFAASRRAQ